MHSRVVPTLQSTENQLSAQRLVKKKKIFLKEKEKEKKKNIFFSLKATTAKEIRCG